MSWHCNFASFICQPNIMVWAHSIIKLLIFLKHARVFIFDLNFDCLTQLPQLVSHGVSKGSFFSVWDLLSKEIFQITAEVFFFLRNWCNFGLADPGYQANVWAGLKGCLWSKSDWDHPRLHSYRHCLDIDIANNNFSALSATIFFLIETGVQILGVQFGCFSTLCINLCEQTHRC